MFFWILVIFILGTAVGSFLNVVIDRIVFGGSILGRSHCDHCQKTLAAFDLIPIVSFVGLGARCRYCQRPMSWQYPLVEALTGGLFVISFYDLVLAGRLEITTLLFYFFLMAILLMVAVVDAKYSLIPTSLVFLACLVSLFYIYFYLDSFNFVSHVFSGFVLAAVFSAIVVVTRGRGMGTGDIPLAFLIGLVTGWPASLVAMFLAFFSGALFSIGLLVAGKKKFGQTVPFGPFLVLGMIIGLFWSDWVINWYLAIL